MSATEASADMYLYCNCTILSNFLHRIRDDVADRFVAVWRNGGNLPHSTWIPQL